MISGVDIEDWKDADFIQVVDDIPSDKQKFEFKEDENGQMVLDMKDFLAAYGRALYARFKLTVNV
jgi:hypothetical protein